MKSIAGMQLCWRWLEQTARQPYVLTVNKRQPTPINFQTCYAEGLVRTIPPEGWQRLSTGAGTFVRTVLRVGSCPTKLPSA